ncbi:hypothetical protein Dda_7315 [Drechslerella dactyloides]|uniref:Uncharacterized protein n=1 Tax=Drechslerella dactyloides TaxID=74499 RepID=A0AAD6NGL2_DREDA|nr:hypothetical protein Dda_7315 [Drechslerella dactyloides]
MFSCVNYERGCRGRCNIQNGRCESCITLNLRRTAVSVFATPLASQRVNCSTNVESKTDFSSRCAAPRALSSRPSSHAYG